LTDNETGHEIDGLSPKKGLKMCIKTTATDASVSVEGKCAEKLTTDSSELSEPKTEGSKPHSGLKGLHHSIIILQLYQVYH